GRLLARFEQHLQTETNAQIGFAGANRLHQRGTQWRVGTKRARTIAESALSRNHHARGIADPLGIGDQTDLFGRPRGQERPDHRAQVAEAGVDDGNHPVRVPFVEGTPATRGSRREASEVARAKAFHSASRMWWAFPP